ncbi:MULTISPECIES: DMT family transporter [unclassified Vibrio]|uniref:DMT family transporter n=1 Tax=Vibrio sp. HB236076 TaxID=3232307 RepID=A0AB39HLH3_9VIBR|nr:DMT family transporter [Vibrio sp. HB161653]MDP5253228.1 DMT family transporter [Vibrio sp. HB161653]
MLTFQSIPLGVRYILISALGFALMSACVKYTSNSGIPLFEIVAARALVSCVISFIDIKRKRIGVWGHNKTLLFLRGAIGSLALMCVYYALTTLPLAVAVLLQYTYPIFTALLAYAFLREKCSRTTCACIAISLLGLMVIFVPNAQTNHPGALDHLAIIIALFGALGSATAYVIVRRLSQTEDSSVIIFYFPFIALPLSVFLMIASGFVMPSLSQMGMLILVGIFTQVGQWGLTKAMQTESAAQASAYGYVQIIFTLVLGMVFFNEMPQSEVWLGGGLIIAAALVNATQKRAVK